MPTDAPTPADPGSDEQAPGGKSRRLPLLAASAMLIAVVGIAVAAFAGAFSSSAEAQPVAATHAGSGHASAATAVAPASAPLRAGERFQPLSLPAGPYQPKAPNGGTDDYRCFLLDPQLADDATLTGVQVLPGNKELVHHAILYRVGPAQVAAAKALDDKSDGTGWTCFGGTLIPDPQGPGGDLDDAPWLAAWAPGGKEAVYQPGSGVKLAKGTQIVLQMHYNLRESQGTDNSGVQLRLSDKTKGVTSVHTMLLPAPVELPCAPGETGRLCDRDAAVADVTQRFGPNSGRTVAGLQLLCGGDLMKPASGPDQACTRRVNEKTRIEAAAGHMHLLGQSISIDVNPGTPQAKTILDIGQWDFDNQGARTLPKAVDLAAGDTVRVRCTHNPKLRSMLPSLQGTEPRYVVWGEGTTDEMCLGILIVTHPS